MRRCGTGLLLSHEQLQEVMGAGPKNRASHRPRVARDRAVHNRAGCVETVHCREELAENELAHVRFYRKTLGGQAVSRPAIDFEAGFAAAAKGAGLPEFDPFANDMNFLLGGMLFEDVGVTAYADAAPILKKKEFVEAAAGILAVEACHMGMARSQLYEMGEKAQKAANALSAARDKLDGPGDKDQGIERNGEANFVPSNADGIAFHRTPQEVLRIVYLTDKAGASSGGFYPKPGGAGTEACSRSVWPNLGAVPWRPATP
jgi:hypothetical protein